MRGFFARLQIVSPTSWLLQKAQWEVAHLCRSELVREVFCMSADRLANKLAPLLQKAQPFAVRGDTDIAVMSNHRVRRIHCMHVGCTDHYHASAR